MLVIEFTHSAVEREYEIPISRNCALVEGLLFTDVVVVIHTLTRILCTSETEQCTRKKECGRNCKFTTDLDQLHA